MPQEILDNFSVKHRCRHNYNNICGKIDGEDQQTFMNECVMKFHACGFILREKFWGEKSSHLTLFYSLENSIFNYYFMSSWRIKIKPINTNPWSWTTLGKYIYNIWCSVHKCNIHTVSSVQIID